MLLMNFDVIIKKMKMPSYCRHLCLYILLFSVVVTFANADDQSDSSSSGSGIGAGHINRPNYIQLNTKNNNNRDLSEISVRKPQTQHHHHHFRHQNSHNSEYRSRSSGNHHKQHNHQSNDSALNRVPGSGQRPSHSLKKHSHYDDDNAAASMGGGGSHTKNHALQQHHHHNQQQQQHHQQQNRLTTMGPFRSRSNNRGSSWSWPSSGEISTKRNRVDNLSRGRQAPPEPTHSSMNRNRTPYNSYIRSHHITKRTTTTTTTTTVAPDDLQEKVFFDAQNGFNTIDNDDVDDDDDDVDDFDYSIDNDYSVENIDNKKRSPNIGSSNDRHHKTIQQSNENFQRDDPVRSSTGYNGITTTTFKSQQRSSNDDNYQLNVNNDGSMNDRPTIETSKSFVETNPITRNIQTRNRNEPGELTKEKFEKLGTATAVEQTFRQQLPEQELRRLASAHAARVSREGYCKWPKPKLIQVPHHTSKTYTPHCTILHRCSDETGCCHVDYKTCQPLRKENVTLAFWAQHSKHSRGHTTVEMLTFENHTECHCVDKSMLNTSNDEPITLEGVTSDRCRCPKYFTNVLTSQCKCDCTSKQPNEICNKLKTGHEHFSIAERRCISTESCERPTCTYGEYDSKAGHCPRQDEALTFASNALNDD